MSPYDPENGRQAKTAAGGFGREEPIEHPQACGFVHSVSGVSYFQHRVNAWGEGLAGDILVDWFADVLQGG